MKKVWISLIIVIFLSVVTFAVFQANPTVADAEVLKQGSSGELVKKVQTKL